MTRNSLAAACLSTVFLGTALFLAAAPARAQTAEAAVAPPVGAFFDVDGDHIYYTTQGTGYPVLLIHGFPLSHTIFNNLQKAFSKKYTVITVDLPGFGRSTTATASQTEAHYATEMLALLAHLNIPKAAIGGHSMGGQVALEIYAQQPAMVRALLLFDTNPAAANIVEQAEWPAYGQMAEQMGSASIAPMVVGVMVTGASVEHLPALGTVITKIVSEAQPIGVAGGGNALATRKDYTSMLGSIAVPTLVIEGQDDPVYPVPIAKALAAAIPNSTLSIIPNTAHATMLQSPGLTTTAINAWIPTAVPPNG